jgi:hypothetical protein
MRHFVTLLMIMLSVTAFSQTAVVAETFPTNKFNIGGSGGQSGSYNGTLSGWSFKSSTSSIIEVDDAPGGGTTGALRFAAGSNGSNNNPRVDSATSPNLDLSGGACTITSMSFQFKWYVDDGRNNNYEVNLQFSGDGGNTWNTVWSNTDLPAENSWNTVVVAGGIPNINSYWTGADFKFRFAARRSSGSSLSDIWFDDIQIFATVSGASVPSFSGVPLLVQGTDLQPGAVYLYQDVVTSPEILDALVKIEVDSNAHVTYLDNNSPNAGRFQPRVANDGTLGSGAETSAKGWVQFSITFIKDDSYTENNPATDADDVYTAKSLSGLRFQHYDVDGFENGSGSGAGYFREIGAICNPIGVYVNAPTNLIDGGSYAAGGYTWRKVLGETGEHTGISSDPDVTFTASFGAVSVIRFRLGFEFVKGNGSSITVDREYATEFTCLTYVQQTTLPVRLISFTGSYRTGVTALNWETENEQNFDHFEIERSSNGADFSAIGLKEAASGNSSRIGYQFPDDLSLVNGNVFYYRLKIEDKDGQFKYSNVIMIRKESKSINGISINPNPVVGGMATVRLTSSGDRVVSFKVIDMNGKVVSQQQNKVYGGNNSISINNLDRLQSGIYLLQMGNGDEITSIKFSIAK